MPITPIQDFFEKTKIIKKEDKVNNQQNLQSSLTNVLKRAIDKKNDRLQYTHFCLENIQTKRFFKPTETKENTEDLEYCVKKAKLNNQTFTTKTSLEKTLKRKIKTQKQHSVLEKQQSFCFPTSKSSVYKVKHFVSESDLKNTLSVLGPELCVGYLKSKELNELMLHTKEIIKDHKCGDFLNQTFIFVSNEFLDTKKTINPQNFTFVVKGFHAKERKYYDNKNVHIFTTLDKQFLCDKKIIILTNTLLNSKGYLRDANIANSYIVQFYDQIEKCKQHEKCSCYSISVLIKNNLLFNENYKRSKYLISNYTNQAEYAEIMKNLMINRIIENIIKARNNYAVNKQ